MVLDARGVPVSERARAAVLACASEDTLRAWMTRAASVASGDALLDAMATRRAKRSP